MIKVEFIHDVSSFKVQANTIDAASLEMLLKSSRHAARYNALNLKLTCLDVTYLSEDNGYDKCDIIYANAKNKVELAEELQAGLMGKEIIVCWNKSITFKSGDSTVSKTVYSSQVPFAVFCGNIEHDKSFQKLGVSLIDCYEKDSLEPFSLDLVASGANPLIVQVPKKQAAYCLSTMPQMLLSIELDERVMEIVKAAKKRSAEGETGGDPKRRYSSAFATLGQQDLDTAIAEAQPEDDPKWETAVVSCRKQLEMVSVCIRPVAEHNEASRRLVIDQVMLAVTHHLQVQFCVDEPQNRANPAPPYTGWGKLDYAVDSKPVVVEVCREAVPQHLPRTVPSDTEVAPQLSEEGG